jgi:hypothetical protein
MTDEHQNETYRSLLSIAAEAIRSLLLLNGGAVVAILTYLGQLHDPRAAGRSRLAIGTFCAGLTFSIVALMFSYLTQYALLNEGWGNRQGFIKHQTWQWTAFGIAVLSLLSFVLGAAFAIRGLAG